MTARQSLTVSALAFSVLAFGALAVAAPASAEACEGHAKGGGGKFKKADKNADGFLTADEVTAERWANIKVADTDKDGKVSKAEFVAAKKAGKLGKKKAAQA